MVSPLISCLCSLPCTPITADQQTGAHWHSQLWLLALGLGLSANPRPEPLVGCAFCTSLRENHTLTAHVATNIWGPNFGATHRPFWFLSVTINNNNKGQHPSVSKHLILSRQPTETKVSRHLSARSWWCYCLDLKTKTKPLHSKSAHT